jgi:hypothetical protein
MPTVDLPLRAASEIGQVRADETRSESRDVASVDGRIEPHVLNVNLENLLAAADVRPIDENVAIEPARPQERGIERLGAIRGGHHDHAAIGAKAVHLDQEGIKRLLALVVTADDAAAARLAERVQLVDEDNARGLRLRLLKHIADAGGPDADKHLNEVRA